jgi:hypothetical protein
MIGIDNDSTFKIDSYDQSPEPSYGVITVCKPKIFGGEGCSGNNDAPPRTLSPGDPRLGPPPLTDPEGDTGRLGGGCIFTCDGPNTHSGAPSDDPEGPHEAR